MEKPLKPSEPQFPHLQPFPIGRHGLNEQQCSQPSTGRVSNEPCLFPFPQLLPPLLGTPTGPTCQRVDKATGQQGRHRDQGPVGEALVPQAAVDGYCSLVTLEDRTCISDPPGTTAEGLYPKAGEYPSVYQQHRQISGCSRVEYYTALKRTDLTPHLSAEESHKKTRLKERCQARERPEVQIT